MNTLPKKSKLVLTQTSKDIIFGIKNDESLEKYLS